MGEVEDLPTLSNHESESVPPSVDTQPGTAAEDSISFFHGLLEGQYKSLSYVDFIALASKTFKPERYIDRANAAARQLFASGLAVDAAATRQLVQLVADIGIHEVITQSAQRLRDARRVLTREAVETVFENDLDKVRLLELADGCDITTHPDFVPNFGEGVSMRANRVADPTAPLLAHALRDAAPVSQ